MYIRLISISNKIDFKWIGFLIELILNGLDHKKNGLDHKNWIFCLPLVALRLFIPCDHLSKSS